MVVNQGPVSLKIKELIPKDDYPSELAKAEIIKAEIEKFMVSKRYMAYQETAGVQRLKLAKHPKPKERASEMPDMVGSNMQMKIIHETDVPPQSQNVY